MERLKAIKNALMGCVEGQMSHLSETDTKELGQAIDMIKDLEEAMYYCSIVKAMEKAEKEEEIMGKYYKPEYGRDMDRGMGRMYYTERQPRNDQGEFISYKDRYRDINKDWNRDEERHREREMPLDLRDTREGRSPMSRRHYMESKELHKDKTEKIKDLEKYLKELGEDIVEMIEDASPEEKQTLERKMTQLTSKISQLNV